MKWLQPGLAIVATGAMLAATGPYAARALTPAAPLVRVDGVHSVSEHVQVIPDNSVVAVPNVGIVIGSKGVLVIDTGLGPRNGAAVAATAQRLAPGRKLWLVATHAHPEHDYGATAFPPGTQFLRSNDQTADAENDQKAAKMFAERSADMAELLQGASNRQADIKFDQSYVLDLGGGVQVRLMALGSNHTDGDTAIWIPGDRVLFSGDVAMKAQPVLATPKTSLSQWFKSLDRLAALQPKVVVPSHGPVGDSSFIEGYRSYLQEVGDRTLRAKNAGKSLDASTAEVVAAMISRYPDRGRLEGAIRVAYGT